LCHALYYLKLDYKVKADALVKALPENVKTKVKKWLLDKGYSKSLVVDETNAYLSTGTKNELTKRFGVNYKDFKSFRQAFKEAAEQKEENENIP
jgi:hypothetical protein